MGSTIFFIVGGFGGCTGLEDYAPTVFSVVLSWLGGFLLQWFLLRWFLLWWFHSFFLICFGGWGVFLMCCRGWAVFSAVLWCFFSAFAGACFAAIGFYAFLEVIRD
jgi:hypothetical protein